MDFLLNTDGLTNSKDDVAKDIFDCVKSQDWDTLTTVLTNYDEKTSGYDINTRDSSNVWLLEYLILFNRADLVQLLLDKNIRLDITDEHGRSILYNVIKFSYTDILYMILEKDKLSIGKSILEIKDESGNIPLFYAIRFFNIESIQIILQYTTFYYTKNSDGDNCIHLAIKSQNLKIFQIITSQFKDIVSKNNVGESYLHLAIKFKCYDMIEHFIKISHSQQALFDDLLNSTEYKYNFTIIHYICISLDLRVLEILQTHDLLEKINGDIQDNSGNTFYHYFINNIVSMQKIDAETAIKLLKISTLLNKINFNINLFNIDGNTPTHIFFSNINIFSQHNLSEMINHIVTNSDINVQNFQGASVFYYMVKNNYWKQIFNILIHKKIDIFIIASDNSTIFDFILKSDYDIFIDMIVKSYLFQLSKSQSTSKWLDYWDNRCKKVLKSNELNDTEKELLSTLNVKFDDNSNINLCETIIRTKISRSIDTFLESKNIFKIQQTSFPIQRYFTQLIAQYPNIQISTFTGSTLDVFIGLIFLCKKFNTIKTSIDLIPDKTHTIECVTTQLNGVGLGTTIDVNKKILERGNKGIARSLYREDINMNQTNTSTEVKKKPKRETGLNINLNTIKICEITKFEILWINKRLILPSTEKNTLCNYIKNLKNVDWFLIPIGIEVNSNSHANYLIISLKNKEIERFEPHGSHPPLGLNYDAELLDGILENLFLDLDFTYYKPSDYLPKIGFQRIEIKELKNDYIGDPNGFCAVWCIWWADMRISNPNIPREKLLKIILRELINTKYSLRKMIRDYSSYITDLRDSVLIKANTNINEWINDSITDENMELLEFSIYDTIKHL